MIHHRPPLCPLQWHRNVTLLLKMTEETKDFLQKTIPSQVFFLLVWVLGLAGNSCVLYFYGRKKRPTGASRSIFFLALSDLWGCVVVMPLFYYGLHYKYIYAHAWLCKLFEWLRYSCLCSSCLLLLTIAVERRYAICRPLQFMRHAGRARRIGPVCFSLGFVLMVPSLWLHGLYWEQTASGQHGCTCNVAQRYFLTVFPDVYRGIMMTLQLTLLVIMVVAYSLVYRTVNNRTHELCMSMRIMPVHPELHGGQGEPGTNPVPTAPVSSDAFAIPGGGTVHASAADTCNSSADESPSTSTGTTDGRTQPIASTSQGMWSTYHQETMIGSETLRRASSNSRMERHFMETIEEESSYTSVFESVADQERHYVTTNVTHYKRINLQMFCKTKPPGRPQDTDEDHMPDSVLALNVHTPSPSRPRPLRQLSTSSWDVPRDDGPLTAEMLARNQRLRYRTAKALLVVTILYLLSWLPYWVYVITKLVKPVWIVHHDPWLLNVYLVTRHLYFVTFAANPVVYASVNSDFRKRLSRSVGPWRNTRIQNT